VYVKACPNSWTVMEGVVRYCVTTFRNESPVVESVPVFAAAPVKVPTLYKFVVWT
jgi:hypothetical protein